MPDAQSAPDAPSVQAAEDTFFRALLSGDRAALSAILDPDFVLVDVMAGSEIPREALADSIGSRLLIFDAIDRQPGRVRQYGAAAVVTGETRMRGRYDGQVFAAHSRYTHVYVRGAGGWQLVSAQGTKIAPSS